nr:unnamed protein product [Callosobruchus analis]
MVPPPPASVKLPPCKCSSQSLPLCCTGTTLRRIARTASQNDAKTERHGKLKLVQLYRDNECLWDLKSQNYRNKEMRATALQNIAQEMNLEEFGPTDVKNKIKNLRATYYLELDKIKKSSKSGADGNVYTPKVKWFEEMDAFIRNVSIQRKTTDNSDTSNNISVPGDHDEINSDAENNSPTPELGLTTSNSNEPTRPRSKRSKLSQMSEMIKDMKNVTQNINMPSEEENDCDIYGKHVASQLKKLSERQFIIAQEEIQKIITTCRLADMENRRLVNIYPNTHFSMRSTTRTPPQQNRYTPSPSPPDVNHSQITASSNSSLGFYPTQSTQIVVPNSSSSGFYCSSPTQSPRYVHPSQVIISTAPNNTALNNDSVECENDGVTDAIKYAFDTA